VRILHIEKFFPPTGGVGSYLRRLSELQRRGGHEVFQFGCVGPQGPPEMPRFCDYTAERGPGAFLRMIHNSQAAARLEAFLRRRSVDVAHLHNIYHHLSPSILPVLARRRIGIVMTVHDYRLACPTKYFLRPDGVCTRCVPNKFYHAASPRCAGLGGAALAVESLIQRLGRRYYRWVDLFLCPTRFMRDVLRRTGVPAGKAVIVPNVIEPIGLPADQAQQAGEVLFTGRLSEEKGPGLLVDAAGRLADVRFVIVGDGVVLGELRREVHRRALSNVLLEGHVDHEQLGRYLARATAVVITSRWPENSPQSMLEAMAAGRCVIVPDHKPLREWVRDGRTGRLFVPEDAASLERVVREVLGDKPGREKMARAAAALVARRHDDEATVARLEAIYKEANRRCALR